MVDWDQVVPAMQRLFCMRRCAPSEADYTLAQRAYEEDPVEYTRCYNLANWGWQIGIALRQLGVDDNHV